MKKILDCRMLRSLVDNLQVSINVFDMKGRRIFVNPYYYHVSGRAKGSRVSPSMATGEDKEKATYLAKKVADSIKFGKVFEIHNFLYKRVGNKNIRKYFDFLIGPLKDDKGKIIGAYTTVKDVTNRYLDKRRIMNLNNVLEKKVRERTKNLERISQEKSMLVSDVAHDIKTMLTIIKGNLEMLDIEKKAIEPIEMECHGEIRDELEKMNQIVSDLVFIANSEQYAKTFKFEKFDLAAFLRKIIKKYSVIYGKKIKIASNFNFGKPFFIVADKNKIENLTCNLIENAVKFRVFEDAHLRISLRKIKSMAQLSFKDNGVGISPEKINFVFSPFFQADKTNNNKNGGFGLGLAICKKIVDAHKGSIVAKSEGIGKGTTVEVLLPIKGKR